MYVYQFHKEDGAIVGLSATPQIHQTAPTFPPSPSHPLLEDRSRTGSYPDIHISPSPVRKGGGESADQYMACNNCYQTVI